MKSREKAVVLLVLIAVVVSAGGVARRGRDDLRVWKAFVADLQAGKMEDASGIRPYYPELLEPMKGYLGQLKAGIAWDKLGAGRCRTSSSGW